MSIRGKHWKPALIVIGAVIALQLGASAVVRSERVKNYLLAHLERTFGRRVEVREFTVSLLPSPELDAAEISVGENPAFGNEYFLRAEHLSAGLRWFGLLRGRFEFGAVSLTRPSLTLVRNEEGRWNLEQWLPPGRPGMATQGNAARAAEVANHLEKIDIDEGRVSFKLDEDKQAFAFVEVSGTVRQAAPGRWELRLEAEPWRSGVQLQSPGTIHVQGEVAGTSARLQPARLQIRWDGASLADVFRLLRGQDTGLRGSFAVDATAESGMKQPVDAPSGQWSFAVQARAGQIHRWDLTERGDNPRVNLRLKGRWNPAAGSVTADEMAIEAPKSNLRGTLLLLTKPKTSFAVHVDSAGVQAADFLAWYRAFQPGVSEEVKAEQYFTGAMTLTGWPLSLDAAAFSSRGGSISIPGLRGSLRVGPLRGGVEKREFVAEPLTLAVVPGDGSPSRAKVEPARPGITVSLTHDFDQHSGALLLEGRGTQVEDALAVAAAFGHPLNFGWEMDGEASTALRWRWSPQESPVWDGTVDFSKARLQVAGLNRPLTLDDVRLNWTAGGKSIQLTKAEGFGAEWSGRIARADPVDLQEGIQWTFDLHADRLDAADLDRWVGPRARPGWVQRLLASLLGNSQPSVSASELLRRANARGVLRADEFDVEKFRFKQLRAEGDLKELHLTLRRADAQWAGGTLQAKMIAEFSPQPKYDIAAQFDRINLAQIPLAGKVADRVTGNASGLIQLKTAGVGREALLQRLSGEGKFQLRAVEFRGWDVAASLASGSPHSGASRWSSGEGTFHVADESFELNALRLLAPREEVLLKGSVSFQREADLTLQSVGDDLRRSRLAAASHVLSIAGPLDGPKISLVGRVAQQPGD